MKKPQEEQETFLPLLRKDIQIVHVGESEDGSPLYNVYDPLRARYFQISWAEALIFKLMRPHMKVAELIELIKERSTLVVTEEELKAFMQDAARQNLLEVTYESEDLNKLTEKKKLNPLMWLLFHYLYMRIPLLDPDEFLGKTLKYVRPFLSIPALIIYLVITISGLALLLNRFDEFLHTFTYFFNFQGIIIYSLAIAATKIIHEFSHAYVAKKFGVRVTNMGVAFLVLWPVLYTDVTDAWKLTKRYQRFTISAAGIIAELVLAGLATWGWAFSSPGILQSIFFLLASVSWVSSLLINLNPAMRFDGYYLLCDLWGIDNLQNRAFAITRWQLRKTLLGLDIPPPEEVSKKRKTGMIIYAIATWIYRLSVYLGVAVFVYFYFTKLLGTFLFLFEIIVFIIWPIITEIQDVLFMKKLLKMNWRIRLLLITIGIALFLFIVPLPHTNYFSAILVPSKNQILYVPYDSVIEKIYVKRQDPVKIGQTLIKLSSESLQADIDSLEFQEDILQRELLTLGLTEEGRPQIKQKQAELKTLHSKLASLKNYKSHLTLKAHFTGIVYEWDDNLTVGQAIAKQKVIGKVAAQGPLNAAGYIPEGQIDEISIGKTVAFILPNPHTQISGKIITINPLRNAQLEFPQLASINQGPLPVVKETNDKLKLVESYYLANVDLDQTDQELFIGQVGTIEAEGPWRSKFMDMMRFLVRLFYRESSV